MCLDPSLEAVENRAYFQFGFAYPKGSLNVPELIIIFHHVLFGQLAIG